MKTPFLDKIAGLNGGLKYAPSDVKISDPKAEEKKQTIEMPKALEESKAARGESAIGPTGPKPTSMTSGSDNVSNYKPVR